ncbi:MAG: hypothetical protein L6R43_07265 [Planctomycetes bacterium]|nr:hypothetical protein [Planctomycetota bacterium]
MATTANVPIPDSEWLKPGTRGSVIYQYIPRGMKLRSGQTDDDHFRAVRVDLHEHVWEESLYEVLYRWSPPSGVTPAVPTIGGGQSSPAPLRSDRYN